MIAVIPYTTFPEIALGPFHLRMFGLMVGLGVLLGAWVGARYAERFGVSRDETYRLATWMVFAGVIGARLTWDLTHWSQIETPIDLIAVWEGGLQFSGGFIAAIAVGFPSFRRWTRLGRWHRLDGYAYGLTLGLAVGRIGCYSVGEHFGSSSSWLLAVRYDGGSTREPATIGDTFHNTALYEFLWLMILFAVLTVLVRRKATPATLAGVFCLYYGICRFLSDFLRVNDETVLGLTGAQWMTLALMPAGIWMLTRVRPSLAAAHAAEAAAIDADAAADAAGPTATTPGEPAVDSPALREDPPQVRDDEALDGDDKGDGEQHAPVAGGGETSRGESES